VEVHGDKWWIHKFELYGFKYMHELTLELREVARQEAMRGPLAVNGEKPNPQNLYNLLVFFNPAVGSLPEHSHLFAEPGCFQVLKNGTKFNRECGEHEETPLDAQYRALPTLAENQRKWEEHIRKFIKVKE
jgi:hypothetical protein